MPSVHHSVQDVCYSLHVHISTHVHVYMYMYIRVLVQHVHMSARSLTGFLRLLLYDIVSLLGYHQRVLGSVLPHKEQVSGDDGCLYMCSCTL